MHGIPQTTAGYLGNKPYPETEAIRELGVGESLAETIRALDVVEDRLDRVAARISGVNQLGSGSDEPAKPVQQALRQQAHTLAALAARLSNMLDNLEQNL